MERASIAKLTRPRLSGIAPRERLFRLLDKGRNRPVTWVASQAGSGKTTLVASWLDERKLPCLWYQVDAGDGDLATFFYYMGLAAKQAAPRHKKPLPLLTPEYLQSIPVFTRRYFEELFRRLKTPAILVLDNYQDAPPDSGFHEMVAHALDTVPEGINLVILSRNLPPQQLAKFQANNRLQLISWDDIRFTWEESGELMKVQGRERPDKKTVTLLHEKTEGWAAGLVLLMAGAGASGLGVHSVGDGTQAGLFDYFANEIFDKTQPPIQHFLLATAFLPRVTVSIAKELTGMGEAGQILEKLSSQRYFTQKYAHGEPAFQYHPLFREFLLVHARSYFDAAELLSVKRKAAALLQSSGRIEDAAMLLIEAGDWTALSRLILREAQTLVTQGRSKTLEDWIVSVPEEVRSENAWLLYWHGVCRLTVSPSESRGLFERALERFAVPGDQTGFLLSWCGVVDSYLYEWNDFATLPRWIDILQDRLKKGIEFPSREIEAAVVSTMTGALFIGSPGRPETADWAERAYDIFRLNAHPVSGLQALVYTFNYFLWAGSVSRARSIVDEMAALDRQSASPLVRITFRQTKALFLNWSEGAAEDSRRLVDEALEMGGRSGVYAWDNLLLAQGVYACLNEGDAGLAVKYLDLMKKSAGSDRGLGFCLSHILEAWLNYLRGKTRDALHCSETALGAAERIGVPFVAILCRIQRARLLFAAGEREKAIEQTAQTTEEIAQCRSRSLEFMVALTEAIFLLDTGDKEGGLDRIGRGLAIGRQEGYGNMLFWWLPQDISRLCAKALEQGIEVEYVRGLIKKRGLVPEQPVDNWPYSVRIATLGRFQIVKDDEPMTFSGKVQKKPLELLKALIALGGTDVPEERITEALWPDADGDQAHRSFETTLYRLRKLLGDKALRFQDGLLSLDKRFCWTDAGEFESHVKNVGKSLTPEAARSMNKAIALYEGHFLPADSEVEWCVLQRERLRDKFTRLVVSLGAYCEERGEWEQALGYFQKGLDIDGLAEEFYQHAMTCQIRLGRDAQAALTYNRCKAVLFRSLGIGPSPRTDEIYHAVVGHRNDASPEFRGEQVGKKKG